MRIAAARSILLAVVSSSCALAHTRPSADAEPADMMDAGFDTLGLDAPSDSALLDAVPFDAAALDAPRDSTLFDAVRLDAAALDAPGDSALLDAAPLDTTPLAAPRPIAPLSTSTVTTRRPTLRWSLPYGADGAHVEICADRACVHPIVTADAVGESYAPSVDLSASHVVFWRLRSRRGGVVEPTSGPTWEFSVPARSAGVDTSSGTTLDVNGDGYADVIVGAYNADCRIICGTGQAHVYLGSATGVSTAPATSLSGPDTGGSFGVSVASAGDVNGDGYADVVIGASTAARVYVYLGGPVGLLRTPASFMSGPDTAGGFGYSVSSAGDVNGDGYADVLVGAFYADARIGRVDVYLGTGTGLSTMPAMSLISPDGFGGFFGWSVASAGDLNGDGFGDVVVGAPAASSGAGRAHVYLGSARGLSGTPATSLSGPDAMGAFGRSVASAGDVNGDGHTDIIIGARDADVARGRAYVHLGNADGVSMTPT